MKPILLLQHLADDGPAHFATWMGRRGIPLDWRSTAAGDAFPTDLREHAALAILGGAWSANDERPSLRQAEALVREAMASGRPVIGHCLGGQLMSRALGVPVTRSPAPERGWHAIRRHDGAVARGWFGDTTEPVVFQWHAEAFGLPDGADALAGNAACPVQAWALGPHLAMQFHIEVDAAKLDAWCDEALGEAWPAGEGAPTVHDGDRMRRDGARHLEAALALADRLYARWVEAIGA